MSEANEEAPADMIIDFHVHSKYSFDCFLEPSVIVEMARRRGLDGLAVTDHDTMAGVREFKSLAPDLYIIPGQEVSTKEGDILGLFLSQEVKPHKYAQGAIEEIRRQGGLAVLAHPFKWPHLARNADFLKRFDAIEAFNARNNIPLPYLENLLSLEAVRRLGLAYVAGSDAHEAFALGRAKTIFDFSADTADADKIKKAIMERRLKIEGSEVNLPVEVISHFSRNLKHMRRP